MSRTQVWSQIPRRYWQTHSFPAYAAAGTDVRLLTMTPDEQACLAALHTAEGKPDGPIARHSERVFLLAEQLAGDREIDRELLRCARSLHDIGLFEPVDGRDAYVTEGRHFAERRLAHWDPE